MCWLSKSDTVWGNQPSKHETVVHEAAKGWLAVLLGALEAAKGWPLVEGPHPQLIPV